MYIYKGSELTWRGVALSARKRATQPVLALVKDDLLKLPTLWLIADLLSAKSCCPVFSYVQLEAGGCGQNKRSINIYLSFTFLLARS